MNPSFSTIKQIAQSKPTLEDEIEYYAEELPAGATVGSLSSHSERDALLKRIRQGNDAIFSSGNSTGRSFGFGYQSMLNFNSIPKAILANSTNLTANEVNNAVNSARATGSASAYFVLQPRRNSSGQVISIHTITVFKPNDTDDGEAWFIETLTNLKTDDNDAAGIIKCDPADGFHIGHEAHKALGKALAKEVFSIGWGK